MFTKSAALYDAIYARKDYRREAERLHALIHQHIRHPATTLLDVAGGTGGRVPHLKIELRNARPAG